MTSVMAQVEGLVVFRSGGEGFARQTVVVYCIATSEELVSRNLFEGCLFEGLFALCTDGKGTGETQDS